MADSFPTRDDYFQIGASEVLARSEERPQKERLSREAVFTEGTDINIIIAACSAMADESTRQLATRMAALFLDSAEGEDLDRLVNDRFSPDVVRKQAAPALVPVSFSRAIPPSAGAAVTYDVGTKVRTDQGTEFTLQEAASLGVGSTGPITVQAQATLAGTAGNVAIGSVTQIVGANDDPLVTIANGEPGSGGRNVESDQSLRDRARAFFTQARRGTLAAIEFGALTVDGVESATAFEELDTGTGLPTGRVSVAIADSNGQANSLLAEAVTSALVEFRAAGIVVEVLITSPLFETISYQNISFITGIDSRAAISQLKSLTVAAVNILTPGEPLTVALLFSLAKSIPGAVVPQTAIGLPGGDVIPTSQQVLKTRLDLVTVNGL